jgi:hypothetical protein
MFKAYHMIAPHCVDRFLSVVAAQTVHVDDQFDWAASPARILRMLLQIRQHEPNEVVLSECFIPLKSIDACQPLTPKKDRDHHFDVSMVLLTIRSTSSRDEACTEIVWYL